MTFGRKLLLAGCGILVCSALLLAGTDEPFWPVYRLVLLGAGATLLLCLGIRLAFSTAQHHRRWMLLALAASFLLRTVLMLRYPGYVTDVNCFAGWSDYMLEYGPAEFYKAGFFVDYPPGYLYYLWGAGALNRLLGAASRTGVGLYILGFLPLCCDLALAWLAFRVGERRQNGALGLAAGCFLAFAPALLYNTAVWKQVDSVFTLALALCFLLLQQRRWALSAALYALALLLKPQALIFGPVLALGFLLPLLDAGRGNRWRVLLRTMACGVLAVGLVWLGSRPFQGIQAPSWMLELYRSSTGTYPYASINAFNLFAGLGGNWRSWEEGWLLTWQQWGFLLIALATLLLGYLGLCWYRRGGCSLLLLAALYGLSIFTLAHGMHERYSLPALVLLALAWAWLGDRRLLRCALAQGLLSFLNLSMALLLLEHNEVLYQPVFTGAARLCGFAQTAVLLAVVWVCLDRALGLGARLRGAAFLQRCQKALRAPAAAAQPWDRRDVLCLCLPTLAAALLAFWNLGSMQAPQSAWHSGGGPVTVETQENCTRLWIYGGLGQGTLWLIDENGGQLAEVPMQQGNLFNWMSCELGGVQGTFTLEAEGNLTVYELALTGPDGETCPVTVSAGGEALFDEQALRPDWIGPYSGMYFDEIYHGRTAYEYLHGLEPYETTHPPLGKELIALGVALFGMTPFGWRFTGALFGVLMLPLFYLLGRLLTGKRRFALLAMLLFALDFMRFTQSRIATVDVFTVFFVLSALLGMLWWMQMDPMKTPLCRQFLALGLSGASFGLACCVKWTGVYAGAGLAAIFFSSLWRRYAAWRKANPTPALFAGRCLRLAAGCVLFFVAVPLLLYAGSYLLYFSWSGEPFELSAVWRLQQHMFGYHSALTATHPFESRWWSWPLIVRPVWYAMGQLLPAGQTASIAVLGNPVLWWVGLAAMVLLALLRLGGLSDERADFLLIAYAAQLLPWAMISRAQFLYHYFGCVPVLALAISYLLSRLEPAAPRAIRRTARLLLLAALALFFWFYPVLSGLPVSTAYASLLQWFPSWRFYAL